MALFSLFKRNTPPSPAVFLLSYTYCYQALPKTLFATPKEFISALQGDPAATLQAHIATFLQDYITSMPAAAPHIPKDFSSMFAAHVRQIDPSLTIALISYPPPPSTLVELQPGKPILAPHFTAIPFNPASPEKFHCFVLGQSPTGGTTLRSVSGENSHGNCGTGCKPSAEDFLSMVSLVEREGVQAAWKRYPQG